MNYYDGNTVTALWWYAQRYAMSDNSFGTTFGPSSPGAVNLVSGDTGGVDMAHLANNPSIATPAAPNADLAPDGQGGFSLTGDAQPYWDDCSTRDAVAMTGTNIGDELNAANVSWGWFQGGFRPTTSFADAAAATGQAGQSTATFVPDEFKNAGFQNSVPHSTNQGICDAVHPVGAGFGGGTDGPVRLQGRLHPAPRAVRVLRLDRQPAPPHAADRGRAARTRLAGWRPSEPTPSTS